MFKILIIILSFFYTVNAISQEQFNFNVPEIEITENGNIFKGFKRGTITTDNKLKLIANEFEYNKNLNILKASGNVKIEDNVNNYIIKSQKITYFKSQNIIITEGQSEAVSLNDDLIIKANKFDYDKDENKITAENNVIVEDKVKNNKIFSNKITYYKNEEKFFSSGKTKALIDSNYDFKSEDLIFYKNTNILKSDKDTTILDNNSKFYKLSKFIYLINEKELKGKNILITTNYNLPKSDKFYFTDAVINLEKNNFIASDTKIEIHKSIFSNNENDPRLFGVSSKSDGKKTIINKAIFTSCKKNDTCPPWSISAKKIEHDKEKKQLKYDHATLKIYDKPVFYFPKFFHPDPSVDRQSGILRPLTNKSSILGSSITLPYFFNISENKDFTFKPSWFDSDIIMLQNEYRQISNKNTELLADFGFVNNYKSSATKKRKNINHLFLKLKKNLDLDNYISSEIELSIEKTNNDSYLKIFEPHITNSKVRPQSFNSLKNQFEITLDHEDYNFNTGVISYEDLQIAKNSDRYQYILPYYNFDKILSNNFYNGTLSFSSIGENNLSNTNKLKSSVVNDLSYQSENFITNFGINNNFNLDIKNLNSLGKNYSEYKSSPQTEIMGILSLNSSMPLQKQGQNFQSFLTPKASLRINPSDMKNYSSSDKKINVSNIFNTNRLGLSDTIESGRSLTLGIDYVTEKKINLKTSEKDLENINNYFELKLATVLRDKEENFIPKNSTINRKTSNIFGSMNANFFKNLDFKYDFALDNDFNELEYNNLITTIKFGDFETSFNFIEENGEMGDNNVIENSFTYLIDDANSIKFNTRRNRKLSLTEYYDLVYEYKNDCLAAGIKYKKTYYEDRDLKPSENLLFTITLFPLTNFEYSGDGLRGK